jgi:hypothetical protein
MQKPGAAPQEPDPADFGKALKARNADKTNSLAIISRLQRSMGLRARVLGRCPRLLHFAPLALAY